MFASIDRIAKSGFNRSYILSAVLALAASACFASPIPVAIWDGDFSNVKTNGYTLSLNGNSTNDACSVITINQSVGVTVSKDEGTFPGGFTVLFKYSDLNLALSEKQVLATSNLTNSNDRTGASINETGLSCGIWAGSSWNNSGTYNTMTSSQTAGVLAFAHYSTTTYDGTGTKLYCLKDGSCTTILDAGTLGSDTDKTKYLGFSVGGRTAAESGFSAATGMKIYAIAAFEGILSGTDMCEYTQATLEMSADTSFSAINAALASLSPFKDHIKVYVPNGATVSVDSVLNRHVCFYCLDGGSITLSAASQPAASYFTNVDFSGVSGAVKRSWLPTPGVVGFNFRSQNGDDVSGALATADKWIHDNNSASGTSTNMFADGLSTLTWSSGGTWACSGSTIISGYLDDGANGGNGAMVTLSNVPYETYDVIVYCSSDSDPGKFLAKTVNGTTYTWDAAAGAVVAGNAAWGKAALSTPDYGLNALRIKNLSGPLTIYGTARNGSNRGGIAAIEIMPPNTPDNIRTYTLTLNGTATTWSEGTWTLNDQTVDAPASGYVEIVASASTTLTVDQAVNLADLKVRGGTNIVINVSASDTGSLYATRATVESGVFQQGAPAVLGATPSIVVASGATFDENGMDVNAANAVTIAGTGAGNWPWALTSSSGAGGAILGGLYLSANATIGGANELKVGQYSLTTGYRCYLQGHTLTKIGEGALTCNNMNTPGTGSIDVQGGAMSVNAFNNLNNNGGDTTVILNSGTSLANGTDRIVPMSALGLYGGTLSTANKAFKVNTAFRGAGETANLAFGAGASASLTSNLTVTAAMTLDGSVTFLKDAEATADVVVTPASLTASTGTITVGAGVTLNLGTNRPAATFNVDNDATLAVQLRSNADVVSLSADSQPTNLIVYAANGIQLDNARVTYSGGMLTIMAHAPTLKAGGVVAFDDAHNWEDALMPSANGDAIINLSGDARITVVGTYQLGTLTISGEGTAGFSGDGSVTAANILLKNGAALTRNSKISATVGIDLDSGTVLKIDGVTESAAISGEGAVVTYGTVVLAHANTMSGGITVKTGSLLSASAAGAYGEYSTGWDYTAQRRVIVEDGGTVDINNIANTDSAVALTIAGKGVLVDGVYAGAVKYSGASAITGGSRQISSLVLMDDALVDLGAGWGLVHNSWNNARLGLKGHTLTVRGTTTFPVANLNTASDAATTGTLILDGATLELTSNKPSNLAGIDIIAKGCASNHIATTPSALGSFTLKPSATGTIAGAWNLPSGFVPSLDTSNIDPAGLSDGQVLTLFTAPAELSSSAISVNAGARFTTAIVGNTVTATVKAGMPANYVHYDFNAGTSKDTARAADSFAKIDIGGEAADGSSNGRAAIVYNDVSTRYTPFWNTYTAVDLSAAGKSPLHACEMTVTAAAKLNQTNMIIWGLGKAYLGDALIGLVALSPTSAAVVTKDTANIVDTIVTVSTTSDLTKGYHFFAVVANGAGTTLYVDNAMASTEKIVPREIGQYGQLGSFHTGAQNVDAPGANLVGAAGFLLDDFRIYDATLSHAEIRAIKRELCPDPLFIRLK